MLYYYMIKQCLVHFFSTSLKYRMAPAIPDRWLDYTPVGTRIEGTRFICFKVPLSKNVQRNTNSPIWDVETLVMSIPDLGCVIDLTNTSRYYTAKEFEDKGVKHVKIMVPGRVIPSERIVRQFFDAVQMFTTHSKEKLIGVHCTHGLNRTGYFVCRYMRDQLKVAADEAIAHFEEARGHTIERQNFLGDLRGLADIPPPDLSRKSPKKRAIAKQSNRDSIDPYSRPGGSLKISDGTQDVRNAYCKSEEVPKQSYRSKKSSHSKDGDSDRTLNNRNSQSSYRNSGDNSSWRTGNDDRIRYNSDKSSSNSYRHSEDSFREVDNSYQNNPSRTRFTANRSYNNYQNNYRDNRGGNSYRDERFNNTDRNTDNNRRSAETKKRSSRWDTTSQDVPSEEGSWRRR